MTENSAGERVASGDISAPQGATDALDLQPQGTTGATVTSPPEPAHVGGGEPRGGSPTPIAAPARQGNGDIDATTNDSPSTNWLQNAAAAAVVICSIGFVVGMLWMLYVQVDRIETSTYVTPVDGIVDVLKAEPDGKEERLTLLGQFVLESDAQFLRTERAQSLVGARLAVMITAELIGLSLIVLGAAFIFARIRGAGDVSFSKGTDFAARALSEFPGVFLCGFGALVVIWALDASVNEHSQIATFDRPLFFPSPFSENDGGPGTAGLREADLLSNPSCLKNADDPSLCALQ